MSDLLTWPLRGARFLVWFIGQLLSSNLVVLRDNLTPGQDSTPGIARFATRCRSDYENTLLASLITLTPGTLTLGTATEGTARVLYVHAMYHRDADELRTDLHDLEDRMLNAVRRQGGDRG